jgi:hypothetical protein
MALDRSGVNRMTDSQWDFYATQELVGTLNRDGLCCPRCDQKTSEIDFHEAESRFQCRLCSGSFSAAEYHAAQRRPPKTGLSTLYRPIGQSELALIEETGFKRFPPRLDWQPIFYPVLTQEYADAIARDWNSTDPAHNFVGFVTRFQVRNEYLCNYEIQTAADLHTLEYWIPAEDLGLFNDNIVGIIEVIAQFRNGKLVP